METCTLPANPNTQNLLALYQENITSIYRFIYARVKNREVAEDLTSQVFLKAVQYVNDQHGVQSIRSWLLRVAHTTVIDYWRTLYRAPTNSLDALLDAGWDIPSENSARGTGSNSAERVQCILQQLSERHREVLTQRFLLKLTVRETAQIMGESEANVKILQFRALKRAATLESTTTDSEPGYQAHSHPGRQFARDNGFLH